MDALKARLLIIQQQLVGLTASQKMLTASLVAIMIMTIVWWGKYAATAEMEPVLDHLASEDVGHVRSVLALHNIDAKVVGNQVMVPSERRLEAVAMLTYEDALPGKSGANIWDDMFKQMSPWDSKSKADNIQNHAKEQFLAQIISSFPNVGMARVAINPLAERRIGGSIEPSASAVVTTKGRETVNLKRLRDAVAATVSSAVSGLSRKNVTVVIDGVVQHVPDPNEGISGEIYDTMKMLREEYEQRIRGLLGPATLVAVQVEVDTTSMQEHRKAYDPTSSVSKESRIETSQEETQPPAAPAAEPGALPNTGLALSGQAPPPSGTPNTIEKSKTEIQNFVGELETNKVTPPGKPTVVSAAVRLPRSGYVNKFKKENPAAKEPDDKAVQTLFEADKSNVRDTVLKTLNLKSEDALALTMYDDGGLPLLPGIGPSENTSGGGGLGVGTMLGGHAKEVVLGLLAMISLFMVSTIVRRSAPAPVIATETAPREAPRLDTEEAVAGIVGGDGNTTLDGMELDEGAVKAQQMVEQVSTMVKENPDAAANLVKRWLNRS